MRGEKTDALGIVGGNNRQDIALGIKLHLVDAHLAVETMYAAGQVMAVIDDVVLAVLLQDGVMARAMNRLVCIRRKDTSLVFKRSHGTRRRRGILHAVGMVVAGTRRISEIIDAVTLEDIGCLEDVLQLGIRNEPLLREELVGSN